MGEVEPMELSKIEAIESKAKLLGAKCKRYKYYLVLSFPDKLRVYGEEFEYTIPLDTTPYKPHVVVNEHGGFLRVVLMKTMGTLGRNPEDRSIHFCLEGLIGDDDVAFRYGGRPDDFTRYASFDDNKNSLAIMTFKDGNGKFIVKAVNAFGETLDILRTVKYPISLHTGYDIGFKIHKITCSVIPKVGFNNVIVSLVEFNDDYRVISINDDNDVLRQAGEVEFLCSIGDQLEYKPGELPFNSKP